jgi:hypothetical protein
MESTPQFLQNFDHIVGLNITKPSQCTPYSWKASQQDQQHGGSGDLNMTKQTNLPSLMGNRMNLFISTIFSLFTKMASIGHKDKSYLPININKLH